MSATRPMTGEPAPFREGFEGADALSAATVIGRIEIDANDPYGGAAALRLTRDRVDMERQPTAATLAPFPVAEGLWDLSVALRSRLHSPDSSYNGTVALEVLDESGKTIEGNELAIVTGDTAWKVFRKRIELSSQAASARFVVRMEKTWGEFHADELAAVYAGRSLKTVAAVKFASSAIANLFLPDDPVRFEMTIECVKPLAEADRSAACVLRDYWGAEFCEPIRVSLTAAGVTDKGRHAYTGVLDLSGQEIVQGKYYEIHAEIAEAELPEPHRESSTFAVLPTPVTKQFAPLDVPFTASGWNPGVEGFFPICDRLGLRVANVYSGWKPEPPYDFWAPGIEEVKDLGMGALMGSMVHAIESRARGEEEYDLTALREGAKRLVNAFKDDVPIIIRNGNEPHPTDDEDARRMIEGYRAVYEGVKEADPNVIVTSTSCGPEDIFFRNGFQRWYDVYDFHQYADADVISADFERYDRMVEKYGMRKPVWTTEIGLNSQGMSRNAVAIQMIKIFTNFFASGGENASWFGLMWPDPDAKLVGTNGDSFDVFHSKYALYSPKLTAITEYNMVNAICVKKVVAKKKYPGHACATLFRDDAGRCLVVAWKDEGRQEVFMPLQGVAQVHATRLDGSANKLDASGAGITITLSDEPYLLEFESSDYQLPDDLGEPSIAVDGAIGTIVKGGSSRVAFRCRSCDPTRIELETPPGWSVVRDPVEGDVAPFTVTAPAATAAREGRLLARIADASGEVHLPVPIIDALEITLAPVPLEDGAAGVAMHVRNHGTTPRTLRWSIAIPEAFTMANGTFKLGEPEPFEPEFTGASRGDLTVDVGHELVATVRASNLDPLTLYTARLEVECDGRTLSRERLFGGCLGVPRVEGGVLFDGNMGDPAWQRAAVGTLDRESQWAVLNKRTAKREKPEDLSGTMHLLWDDEYLYLGMRVQDDVFCQPECDDLIWRGDGLQFLVDPCRASTEKPGKYDYCVALGTKGLQASSSSTADAALAPTGNVEDFILKITPTGHRGDMVYEVAIPWRRLSPFEPAPGANLGLGMIINDDDGLIRDSFIAWFGCAHSKQMSMNGDLILCE